MNRRTLPLLMAFALSVVGPASLAAQTPGISLATLERSSPGWRISDQSGDAAKGMVTVERVIWPMFYLHWKSLEGVGETVSLKEAEKAVAGLWKGLAFDTELQGQKTRLPGHEGVVIQTTTSQGTRQNQYFVWACPQSGRLLIADTSLSLEANAPNEVLEQQAQMVRTVRCHPGAPAEEFPLLRVSHDVPEANLSYSHPAYWAPIAGYRVQEIFGGTDFSISFPASTAEKGQDLVLASDALRRLHFTWGPSPDYPMSYDVLKQRAEDFWRDRAVDMMVLDNRVSNDVWIADGIVRPGPLAPAVPPARHHKFRAWMWRKDGMTYFAVGQIAGARFGRRILTESQSVAAWDLSMEEMFQAILY